MRYHTSFDRAYIELPADRWQSAMSAVAALARRAAGSDEIHSFVVFQIDYFRLDGPADVSDLAS
jgi:hypothetical protein